MLTEKLVIPMTAQSVDEVHDIETPVATPVPEEEPPQELLPMSPPPPTPRPVESPPKVSGFIFTAFTKPEKFKYLSLEELSFLKYTYIYLCTCMIKIHLLTLLPLLIYR